MDHYSLIFQKFKSKAEKKLINTSDEENYNIPFSINELKESLSKCHNTATGPDYVLYQFLKRLPEIPLFVLFNNGTQ